MRIVRLIAVPVLLYLALDVADAQLPGVFSFASDQLFIDGVVQLTSDAGIETAAMTELAPFHPSDPRANRPDRVTARSIVRARRPPPRHIAHQHSRPPDSAPRSEDH